MGLKRRKFTRELKQRVFPGCSEDQCPTVFGQTGDKPVAFGKSLVKGN